MLRFDGEKLLGLRKSHELTQAKLAEEAGTSEHYIRDLERGRKWNPSAALVFRLARILEVTMDTLMKEEAA